MLLDGLLLSLVSTASCVHVACVDAPSARQVAERIGPTLEAEGVSVGLIEGGSPVEGEPVSSTYVRAASAWLPVERGTAYGCRVVCGGVTALAFDYLRDSLPGAAPVQSCRDVLVLPDADRLLDESRTPLIIAAPAGMAVQPDEAAREAAAALERGRDYVVQTVGDGSAGVVLLDKTGDPLPGRRWCGAVHGLIEAREGLPVTPPAQTLAQTTPAEYAALYQRRVAVLAAGTSPDVARAIREGFAAEIVTEGE
jgi:preprotein translocase subunit SecA